MKVRNEIRNGTFNQSISKPSKNPKNPDMKGLLDSTKHTTFEGPKLPGMNKPLKPIPVFKQNPGEHKRRRKNKNKTDENVDFNDFKDHISFGERVDAPPTLKLKKFTKTPSSKPASEGKSDLLLKKNLKHGVKKAKLSMAQKVAVEKDRQHVVELYRQIK